MPLKMADGPPDNLPKEGMNAVAGYVDDGGIGVTYPQIVVDFPHLIHFSISVHGATAQCGDVEKGALNSWKGYDYGYCDLANAQSFINHMGRPKKLWIAHHNDIPHICDPSCGFGFTDHADGTQWTDHGGKWDESLLADNFFTLEDTMGVAIAVSERGTQSELYVVRDDGNPPEHWWRDNSIPPGQPGFGWQGPETLPR